MGFCRSSRIRTSLGSPYHRVSERRVRCDHAMTTTASTHIRSDQVMVCTTIPHARGRRTREKGGIHLLGRRVAATGPHDHHPSPGSNGSIAAADPRIVELSEFNDFSLALSLEHSACRDDTLCYVAPQRNQQLARHCHDSNPPDLAASVADTFVEPAAQLTSWLIA
jgi:hypothetical protein